MTRPTASPRSPTPPIDADASGPQWVSFLAKVLPDKDVRDYMQRLAGLSLPGEVNGDKQIAPIAYGGGANGKTTFIEAVCFALGDYAMTAEPTLLMSKRGEVHPTGVADLLGKRLVSTTETQQGARFDIALLKRLTGGDTLKARWMRQNFFQFTPVAPADDVHQPSARDRRRQRGGVAADPVDPVHRRDPRADRDEGLKDKLAAEADAVLSWAIDGWADYRRRGPDEPARRPGGHRGLSGGLRPGEAIHSRRMFGRRRPVIGYHQRTVSGLGEVGSKGRLPVDEHDHVRPRTRR